MRNWLTNLFNFSDSIDCYFFNKTSSDIWLREQFDELRSKDVRVSIKHILSDADATWVGQTGRVTKELIEQIAQSSTFVLVCGPAIFSDITVQYLKEYQVELHCFQG